MKRFTARAHFREVPNRGRYVLRRSVSVLFLSVKGKVPKKRWLNLSPVCKYTISLQIGSQQSPLFASICNVALTHSLIHTNPQQSACAHGQQRRIAHSHKNATVMKHTVQCLKPVQDMRLWKGSGNKDGWLFWGGIRQWISWGHWPCEGQMVMESNSSLNRLCTQFVQRYFQK